MARCRNHDRSRKVLTRLAIGYFLSVFPILLFHLGVTEGSPEKTGPVRNKHVLLFYSDNVRLPFSQQQDKVFRESLTGIYPDIAIYSENLDSTLSAQDTPTRLAADFYRQKYKSVHFDAIVAIKPSALAFLLDHDDVFGNAPVVFCNVGTSDSVLGGLRPGVTGVEIDYSMVPTYMLIRQVQPDTKHIVIILGASSRELALQEKVRSEAASLAGELSLEFWSGLPPENLKAKLSQLPSQTVVLYVSESRDEDGHTFVPRDLLEQIAPSSNVPIYSIATSYLGTGTIGGRMIDGNTDARMATDYVERILNGEKSENLKPVVEPAKYSFDARVMKRFHIAESQLPAGSEVLFRDQDVWQKYRRYFILGILALVLQSFLIVALTIGGQRRKKMSLQLKDLSRRLIDAQEGERRRIARELHDDLNQRMVLLLSHLEGLGSSANGQSTQVTALSREAREISTGIGQLSHQLHSSALEILGLEAALQGLTRDLSLAYGLNIAFSSDGELSPASAEVNLCLFRVAQESLSNALKHSCATSIAVRLCREENGNAIRLMVIDDGTGFDQKKVRTDSLGLISMRDRLRLVDGELLINSSPNHGTEVIARVKLNEPQSLTAHG